MMAIERSSAKVLVNSNNIRTMGGMKWWWWITNNNSSNNCKCSYSIPLVPSYTQNLQQPISWYHPHLQITSAGYSTSSTLYCSWFNSANTDISKWCFFDGAHISKEEKEEELHRKQFWLFIDTYIFDIE